MGILDKNSHKPGLKSTAFATILIGSVMMIFLSGLLTYWLLGDRAPPLVNVEPPKLIEYDPAKNYMVVEFAGDKKIKCPGERRQKLVEPGQEPPARTGLSIPAEPFEGTAPLGHNVWRRMIDLPQNRPIPFVYLVTAAFTCNPTQIGANAIPVTFPPLFVGETK